MTQTELTPTASQTGKWKPYPAYKNSGVEWLGEIPAHWEAKKIKRLCQVKRGASPRPIDDPIYFDDEGEYAWVRISDVTASAKYLQKTEQKLSLLGQSKSICLEPGQLFLSIAATVGKPIITQIRCCIHDGFVYFIGLNQYKEFLFYVFSGGELYKGLGKLGTQLNLNTDTIGDIRIPTPPIIEQRAIAVFLDHETARLNALVAKKERLIELLQEKRAALISHAVTKGLDPTVPMKDSGVEWLGEIPEHWEVKRVRNVTELLQTGPFGSQLHSSDYSSSGIPVINPSHLKDGRIYPDWDCTVDDEFRLRLVRHELHEGDIVFARRGEMGRCALVTEIESGWLCGTGSLLMRPRVNLTVPSFLNKVLSTNGVKDWLLLESVGSTMDNLNTSILSRIPLPILPLSEQQAIIDFIDHETAKIDALVSRIRDGIEKLKEYSTALISAAVTGKIDVREEKPLPVDGDLQGRGRFLKLKRIRCYGG